MLKKVFQRCALGAPVGALISILITVIISFSVGDGKFYFVVPTLIESFGNEINAFTVQFVFSCIYGAFWAGASLVWETDYSILKQTVIHFCIVSFSSLPIAYFMHWMEHSVVGFLGYFGIFISVYLGVWAVQYSIAKKQISALNLCVQQNKSK